MPQIAYEQGTLLDSSLLGQVRFRKVTLKCIRWEREVNLALKKKKIEQIGNGEKKTAKSKYLSLAKERTSGRENEEVNIV